MIFFLFLSLFAHASDPLDDFDGTESWSKRNRKSPEQKNPSFYSPNLVKQLRALKEEFNIEKRKFEKTAKEVKTDRGHYTVSKNYGWLKALPQGKQFIQIPNFAIKKRRSTQHSIASPRRRIKAEKNYRIIQDPKHKTTKWGDMQEISIDDYMNTYIEVQKGKELPQLMPTKKWKSAPPIRGAQKKSTKKRFKKKEKYKKYYTPTKRPVMSDGSSLDEPHSFSEEEIEMEWEEMDLDVTK